MNESDFEWLITLKNTGSITAAANRLHITQPTLSKQIAALEHELGVTLFLRSRNGVRFTPEGERVLTAAKEASKVLRNMRIDLENVSDQPFGAISLGIAVDYATYRLPAVLAEMRKAYPGISTRITAEYSRNLYQRLLREEFDAAILRGEFRWKGPKYLLSEERVCAIMAPQFKDLPYEEIPFIHRHTDSAMEQMVERWLEEQHLTNDGNGVTIDAINAAVRMVEHGLGWAIVSEIGLEDFNGIIRPLYFTDGTPIMRRTYLLCTEQAARLPQIQAFIGLVKRYDA